MPRRITTDVNGVVISVESIPERVSAREQKLTIHTKTAKSPVQKRVSNHKVASKYKMVRCPSCRVMIKESSLKKHLLKKCDKNVHKESSLLPTPLKSSLLTPWQTRSGRTFVRCSKCQVNVRESNWQKHLTKVHPKPEKNSTNKDLSLKEQTVPIGFSQNREKIPGTLSPSSNEARLVARGLIEETQFGDKYVGQYNREVDGRFGSISLYDDYSEESYPD